MLSEQRNYEDEYDNKIISAGGQIYINIPGYLDTCRKNDIISFSWKRFCALRLRLPLTG